MLIAKELRRKTDMQFRKNTICYLLITLLTCVNAVQASESNSAWTQVHQTLSSAAVSTTDSKIIVNQARMRHIAPQAVSEWAQILVKTNQQGLSVEPMVGRMLQGLAKGVPTNRIDTALKSLSNDLAWAKQLLSTRVAASDIRAQPQLTDSSIKNIEVALRSGFSPDQLQQIMGDKPLNLKQFNTVTDMANKWHGMGTENQAIADTLQQAIQSNMNLDELSEINQAYIQGMQQGMEFDDISSEMQQHFQDMPMDDMQSEFNSPDNMMDNFTSEQSGFDMGEDTMQDMGMDAADGIESSPDMGSDFDTGAGQDFGAP